MSGGVCVPAQGVARLCALQPPLPKPSAAHVVVPTSVFCSCVCVRTLPVRAAAATMRLVTAALHARGSCNWGTHACAHNNC
jgi:hypothetical protein